MLVLASSAFSVLQSECDWDRTKLLIMTMMAMMTIMTMITWMTMRTRMTMMTMEKIMRMMVITTTMTKLMILKQKYIDGQYC